MSAGVALLAAGCTVAAQPDMTGRGQSHARLSAPVGSTPRFSPPTHILRTASPTRVTPGAKAAASAATVRAERLLDGLAVKGRAPLTGYDRDEFGPAWTDDNDDAGGHNGCDTRNDILRRDLRSISYKPDTHGCLVLTGVLDDPYTGTTIHFTRGVGTSLAVQIDHVVALADAWQTGAQYWPESKRIDLANDPLELLAVDGSANESKGDGDAATWLPPRKAFRCTYVERQIAVKARYDLWTTPAEHEALGRVLGRC